MFYQPVHIQQLLTSHPEISFYLKKIIEKLNPEKVILFGSKARGDTSPTSDTDMAVLTDHFFDTTEIFGAVDIVNLKTASSSLKKKILKEGIILYERKQPSSV